MSTPPPYDLGDGTPPGPSAPPSPRVPGTLARWKLQGGFLGGIATLGIVLLKLAPILKLGFLLKGFITLGSMLVSMWVYSLRSGWPMAIGIVLMIFVHECGHALAARRFKLPYAGMLFIPMLGGVVFHRKGDTTVVQDAFVGIMGPFVGRSTGWSAMRSTWRMDRRSGCIWRSGATSLTCSTWLFRSRRSMATGLRRSSRSTRVRRPKSAETTRWAGRAWEASCCSWPSARAAPSAAKTKNPARSRAGFFRLNFLRQRS